MSPLLITLRFYATERFQVAFGDLRGFQQATVSRVITKVTRVIARQSIHNIQFPHNDQLQENLYSLKLLAIFLM